MFSTIGRSWEFAKISYGILWDNKSLLLFPLASGAAAILVMISFAAPLWLSGTLEAWMQVTEGQDASQATTVDQALMWVTLFLFYFCNYFVIAFFNAGLIACAMKVMNGETPTVWYGLSVAASRLPQIFAWALVGAVVGVALKAIENMDRRIGAVIAAVLGFAWTVLTYFVVPVIVVEGMGPIAAFKKSGSTLRETWGEALVGHFSLGFLSLLLWLPVGLIGIVLVGMAISSGSAVLIAGAIMLLVVSLALVGCATSAADTVFKALLYCYATGRTMPANVDASHFDEAFAPKD